MANYRKKPVIVEAVQFLNGELTERCPNWLSAALNTDPNEVGSVTRIGNQVFINTLEGEMKGNNGDYIIRGVNGEIYPCKPDIFEKTYEKVD